ncbi:MAG: thiamine ABC transporter substrate-binding protein [Spirochaetota bacterium]
MKRLMLIVLAVFLALALIACQGEAESTSEAQEEQEEPVESVTVYAYDSFVSEWGPGPAIVEQFTDKYGIEVDLRAVGDSGQVLQRTILEKEEPEADVVIGIDNNMLYKALDEEVFTTYKSPQLEHIDEKLHFDPSYHVIPYDYGYFSIIYDSQRITEVPKSLEDLTKSSYEDSLILMDPRTSSPGLGFLLWTIEVYGEDFPAYWERLKPSVLTVSDGWDTGYGLFTNGEAPMVLSYTTSPAYHVEYEDDTSKQVALFDNGHYLQVEGVAITEGAPNPEGAKQFVDFLLAREGQEIIPLTNWMYPVRDDVELPDSFDYAPKPEDTLSLPTDEIDSNLDNWIDQWVEVMSR